MPEPARSRVALMLARATAEPAPRPTRPRLAAIAMCVAVLAGIGAGGVATAQRYVFDPDPAAVDRVEELQAGLFETLGEEPLPDDTTRLGANEAMCVYSVDRDADGQLLITGVAHDEAVTKADLVALCDSFGMTLPEVQPAGEALLCNHGPRAVAVVRGYDTCEDAVETPDQPLTSAEGGDQQLLDELNLRRATELGLIAMPSADPACATEAEAQARLDSLAEQIEALDLRVEEGSGDDPADGPFIGTRCWQLGVSWPVGVISSHWGGDGYFENDPTNVPT
jgi:hypothetical protein